MRAIALVFFAMLGACASPASSVLLPVSPTASSVAILPLEGKLGGQAEDLLALELADKGIGVVERSRTRQVLAIDTDFSPSTQDDVQLLNNVGSQLGVDYVFSGTVSTDQPPLGSYPHVFMTLRLLEVENGQTRWIGKYGDSMWTSAFSTQGDLKRGVKNLVKEFTESGGAALLLQSSNSPD
jgi:TolB-like protein